MTVASTFSEHLSGLLPRPVAPPQVALPKTVSRSQTRRSKGSGRSQSGICDLAKLLEAACQVILLIRLTAFNKLKHRKVAFLSQCCTGR